MTLLTLQGIETEAAREAGSYELILICDQDYGLMSRILNVYEFFQNRPRILVIRRGGPIQFDKRLARVEAIPGKIKGLEERSVIEWSSAALSTGLYVLYSIPLALRLLRKRTRVRLVHVHFIFPQGLFGLLLAFSLRVPLVVTAMGRDVNVLMPKNGIIRVICRAILNRAYVTIAVSKPLQHSLRQFNIKNTIYIPNSIDIDSIQPVIEQSDPSILYVGSMTANKQPLTLLHAFELVAKDTPDAKLTMCGVGPLLRSVEDEVSSKRLENRVKVAAYLDPKSLNVIRSRSPIFVLPSESEGLSLALLEAMAAGQAIIVSRIQSHTAILQDNVNALFFDVGDEIGLAKQIQRAIHDKELRLNIGKAARELCMRQFTNQVAAAELESVYQRLPAFDSDQSD